ncbi:hypothetical protein Slin14017_G034410 [Septoria linicola]|nr:hypothetical protein Slin14017_G034410 [Septoria linicola]
MDRSLELATPVEPAKWNVVWDLGTLAEPTEVHGSIWGFGGSPISMLLQGSGQTTFHFAPDMLKQRKWNVIWDLGSIGNSQMVIVLLEAFDTRSTRCALADLSPAASILTARQSEISNGTLLGLDCKARLSVSASLTRKPNPSSVARVDELRSTPNLDSALFGTYTTRRVSTGSNGRGLKSVEFSVSIVGFEKPLLNSLCFGRFEPSNIHFDRRGPNEQ